MKRCIITILAALATLAAPIAKGQTTAEDDAIFGAMQAELRRSVDSLSLAGVSVREGKEPAKPFWLGYLYSNHRAMVVSATLGEVVISQLQPYRTGGVRLLLGDGTTTSDLTYDGSWNFRSIAAETAPANIRREFWLSTDAAYKEAARDLARKYAILEQKSLSDEDAALNDLEPVQAIEKVVEGSAGEFDRATWESLARELSTIFADFPSLYSSRVWMGLYERTDRVLTSEGVRLRLPTHFASIRVSAKVRTPDGEEFSDALALWAPCRETLPAKDSLAEAVRGFARRMASWAALPRFEGFYSGPVLFVGEAVFRMFDDNLLAGDGSGLLVKRKPAGVEGTLSPRRLEKRIGQRVLDRRLGVVNHTSDMSSYRGVPLLGYHEMGADGIPPEPSRTLVEAGVVKSLLGGRIPTPGDRARRTDYSNRFSVDGDPYIAPGTLEITATQSTPLAELEGRLVELARADGLPAAYIVESRDGGVDMVWQLDVASGTRRQLRGAEVMYVGLPQLKRVAGISREFEMRNYLAGQVPASMIYPRGMLLEDVEIGVAEVEKEKPLPIDNPLMRN